MQEKEFTAKARALAYVAASDRLDKTDEIEFSVDDTYVVWFVKALQNWKALVSTTLPDGKYYEITYNGDKKETYVDVYVKVENICVRDEIFADTDLIPLMEK